MRRLRNIQSIDIEGKTVLMRVDHNVVKKGKIIDTYRIDASLPTIKYVIDHKAKLILMTHVGRPRDKNTGMIEITSKTAVTPIVEYLRSKGICIAELRIENYDKYGIENLSSSEITTLFEKSHSDVIYLPNTRWFKGEEAKDNKKIELGKIFADSADVFVNDAFGSWQPHASTTEPAKIIPAYAGLLMQKEIDNLDKVINPERPFIAVIAGSKFDTKIQPLKALLKKTDYLLLGGVIFNAYLSAKYKIYIDSVTEADIKVADEFVKLTEKYPDKLIEPKYIVESDILEGMEEGKYRKHRVSDLKKGQKLNFVLDIANESFDDEVIKKVFSSAGTFFVNAVMGLTPHFSDGTIALDKIIARNKKAVKLFGGGDTLQEFKTLLPELYKKALADSSYYFFTGGGTILKAISENSPWGLEPVQLLLE